MSTVFTAAQFVDTFKVSDCHLKPLWRQEMSRNARSETIVKDLGPMLWKAFYTTIPMKRQATQAFESRVLQLQGGMNLFEGYDLRSSQPIAEIGTVTSGLTILSVNSGKTAFKVTGLPAGYQFTIGDKLSVDDGLNLHLFYLSADSVASEYGETAWLEVQPNIRPAIAAGNTVTLTNPCARFMIVPDSVNRFRSGRLHEVFGFEALQVSL